MTQNKLVGFCYLFIVGIVLCMAFPAGPAAVAPMWQLTALLALLAAGALVLLRRYRRPPPADADLSPFDVPVRFDISLKNSLLNATLLPKS